MCVGIKHLGKCMYIHIYIHIYVYVCMYVEGLGMAVCMVLLELYGGFLRNMKGLLIRYRFLVLN